MPTDANAVPEHVVPVHADHLSLETGNDRFKKSFASWFWSSMITATVLHFMLFQLWPTQTAEVVAFAADELTTIVLPPEIEIPPPPEAITRPATPVMATTDIDDDITIAPTTFDENPIAELPPPPTNDTSTDLATTPAFTPMTVRPEVRNMAEVEAALAREYPPLLRDVGIGGRVVVWFLVSEEGRVLDRRVFESSGYPPLDEAALRVADVFRFTPALNREQIVQVWIQLPIVFRVQ